MTYLKRRGEMLESLCFLALPILVENILQLSLGFIDTYFVSLLGDLAISGVGVTNLMMNLYLAFFQAISIGSTAILSRQFGAKNYKAAGKTVEESLLFTVYISLIMGLISFLFAENILGLLGVQGEIMDYSLTYFRSVASPIIFLALMTIMSSILRARGDSKTPMKVNVISNILNVILNYLLMFGFLNFKGLGILGIGLATSISRLIGSILLARELDRDSKLSLARISSWRSDRETRASILRIGLPAGLEKLIMRLGQLVYGRLIIKIGLASYTAHNIAGQIESFSYLPAMAFGLAGASLIGQSLGSEDPEAAKKYGLYAYGISTGFMIVIGGLIFIFAPDLTRIFTSDGEIIDLSVSVLRMIALFQPFLASTQVLASCLQGAGDTKFPMYLTLLGIWFIRVLPVYLLGKFGQPSLIDVWTLYIIDIIFRGTILLIRYNKGDWQDIKI